MMSRWYPLDNAAKIFPPSKNRYDAKIFRFSVSLKENIDAKVLQDALNKTLEEYPIFKSNLKRGFFWYYLEESNNIPKVKEESSIPCTFLKQGLFVVTYYKKRINLEVNHALTDGTGTLMFLKSLTANYLNLKHNIRSREVINLGSNKELKEDAFKKYKTSFNKRAISNKRRAFKVQDEKYEENNLKVIEGIVRTNKVRKIAKMHGATVTVYLTSVLIKSIGDTMNRKEQKRPIVVAIPVNLRQFYPSYTVRNFFSAVSVSYDYNNDDLVSIINEVNKQFTKILAPVNIQNKMNNLAILEDIFILKVIPVFIKDGILKLVSWITGKYQTMTLSNIGKIEMPKVYQEYIDYFDVFISTDAMQLCMCSYEDNMVLSFTSQFVNSEIERNFFKYLTNEGIDVDINTNRAEEDDE